MLFRKFEFKAIEDIKNYENSQINRFFLLLDNYETRCQIYLMQKILFLIRHLSVESIIFIYLLFVKTVNIYALNLYILLYIHIQILYKLCIFYYRYLCKIYTNCINYTFLLYIHIFIP